MANPISLHFAPGSYGAIAQGHVTPGAWLQAFTLNVRAGQTMIVTFTGAGAMRGEISGPGGGGGPFYGGGDSFVFPASGTFTLEVGANTMAGSPWTGGFTLAVLVN
jgi:hypothetical protein